MTAAPCKPWQWRLKRYIEEILELMMSLSSNANVWNTCLRILRLRGYTIQVEGELDGDGCRPFHAMWIAEKDDFRFVGDNPIELLGLVGIHDHVRPGADAPWWWYIEGEDIWDEVMLKAFPVSVGDESIVKK